MDHVKEMVCILDMGGEGFNKGLEVRINVSRDASNRGTIGGDNGAAGVTWFVYLTKEV